MAASTLRELVKANLPETWKVLSADAEPALISDVIDVETEDLVGDALTRVVDKYWQDRTDADDPIDPAYVEAQYGRFVKGVVADMATRFVIPAAKDYYMVRTRTADSESTTPVEGVGGDTSSNYNRVDALTQLDETLRLRIADDLLEFLQLIAPEGERGTAVPIGPRVSSMGETMRTQDPDSLPRLGKRSGYAPWPVW